MWRGVLALRPHSYIHCHYPLSLCLSTYYSDSLCWDLPNQVLGCVLYMCLYHGKPYYQRHWRPVIAYISSRYCIFHRNTVYTFQEIRVLSRKYTSTAIFATLVRPSLQHLRCLNVSIVVWRMLHIFPIPSECSWRWTLTETMKLTEYHFITIKELCCVQILF